MPIIRHLKQDEIWYPSGVSIETVAMAEGKSHLIRNKYK